MDVDISGDWGDAGLGRSFGDYDCLEPGLEPTAFSPGKKLVERLGGPVPKAKPRPAMNLKPISEVNSRDVKLLRKEAIEANKRAEAAEEKVADFRDKLKSMRAALATQDKQLSMAKRSVEYLGLERDQLKATLVNDQAHTRKLEAKIGGQKGLTEITAQWKAMKVKMKSMEDTVRAAEGKLLAAEEVQRAQKAEINTLRLALEVKARELSAIGGQEISSRLIYSVAQSREEGVALAIQLAEQREATALAEGNIRRAEMRIKALEEIVRDLRVEKGGLEGAEQLARAEARHAKVNHEASMAQVEAALERQARLEDEKEKLQEDLRKARDRVAALKEELQAMQHEAQRAGHSSRRDMVAALDDVARAATKQHEELREELRNLRQEHREQEVKWIEERSELQRRAGQAEAEAKHHASRVAELESKAGLDEAQLQDQVSNLRSDVTAITEINHRLHSKLEMAQNTRDAAEQSNFDLQKKVKCLTGELEEAKRAADAAAQAKVNIILQDLCSASNERDRLAAELKKASDKSEAAVAEHTSLKEEVNRLKRMNESLGESKAELQRSMMREVADVRAQVRLLEKENEQLREWRPLPTVRNSVAEAAPRITTTTSDDELPTVPRSGSEYYQHTGAYAYAAACSDTPPPSSRRPNDSVPRPYTSRTAPDVYRADFLQPAPCPTLRKPDPDPYYPVPGYSDDSHPGRATDGVGAYNEAIWSSSGRFAGDDELDANRRSVGGASAVANAYEYRVPTSVNVVEGYSYQPQRGNPENPRAVQMSRPYEAVGTRYEELTAAASLPAGSLRIASRGGGAELQSPPDSPTSQGFGFDGRQPLTLSELANVDLDADSFLLAAPLE